MFNGLITATNRRQKWDTSSENRGGSELVQIDIGAGQSRFRYYGLKIRNQSASSVTCAH